MKLFLPYVAIAMCNLSYAGMVKTDAQLRAENKIYDAQIGSLLACIAQHLTLQFTAPPRTMLDRYQEELSDAAFTDDVEKIKILLRAPGIEINKKNRYGQTPLQRVLSNTCITINPERKIQSIVLLLNAQADPSITSTYGINFYNDVFHHLHPEIMHDIRVQDALKRSAERIVHAPNSPSFSENSSSLRIVVPGKEFYLQATELPTPPSPLFSASFDEEEAPEVTFDEEEDVVHWHLDE